MKRWKFIGLEVVLMAATVFVVVSYGKANSEKLDFKDYSQTEERMEEYWDKDWRRNFRMATGGGVALLGGGLALVNYQYRKEIDG